jgi:leucyl/phenylalanyl-tRNA---protein transferase
MAVFELPQNLVFPHPRLANEDGLLAIGGDLSVDRLLLAYANGIFPWYTENSPVLWWSPDPRMVLFPDKFKISKSLMQVIRSERYNVTFDNDFEAVIRNCAEARRNDQEGTWIVPEMQEAYIELHAAGFAHSVETWHKGKLAGGLYGVSLGRMFFGESMFFNMRDASKVALYFLVERLKAWEFMAIDVQQDTTHLQSLGAASISLENFLDLLKNAIKHPTIKGKWC